MAQSEQDVIYRLMEVADQEGHCGSNSNQAF